MWLHPSTRQYRRRRETRHDRNVPCQTFEEKKRAIQLYESVIRLRPKYAQSYRDLANAYMENDQFKLGVRSLI